MEEYHRAARKSNRLLLKMKYLLNRVIGHAHLAAVTALRSLSLKAASMRLFARSGIHAYAFRTQFAAPARGRDW